MTDDVRAVAGPAGMFRLVAPREVGGLELSLPELYDVIEELAAADPSVAWHAANSTIACRIAGFLGEAERAELFEEPDYPYGFAAAQGGRAVPTDGGFRLSGRWGFVTGINQARWCALGAVVVADGGGPPTDGPPDARLFLVRRADLEVHPTFQDATSMRGTGSHAASAEDLFVPEGFVFRPTDPPQVDSPLYRLPTYVMWMPIFGGMGVGIVRAALAGSIELMGRKSSSVNGAAHYDQPHVKATIVDAHAQVRALRAGMRDSSTEVWDAATAAPEVDLATRAQLYASGMYTLSVARRIVSDLYISSSSVVYAGRNPVERALRDAHAVAAAIQGGPWAALRFAAGRVLLGYDPEGVPLF